MQISPEQQTMLRQLPGVDQMILAAQAVPELESLPKAVLVRSIREALASIRQQILTQENPPRTDDLTPEALVNDVVRRADALQAYNLQRTINATGVVVHTNLGRSCLATKAIEHVVEAAAHYSNLEFDIPKGRRGSRYSIIEELLCELSGAEAALAVNNNAGAVLLCLDTLANGREVIISRGELVEIGGSFRIPDVMRKSGAILKEVGTTNRTHLKDYQQAVSTQTGLLLKVHASNYAVIGFTKSVSLEEMTGLGKQFNIPVMEDLGSGNFIDLPRYGLAAEPTVQDSVAAGVDVVTFSGDKLLGGPQAGLIVGKKELLEQIKANPLTRALRIDKMTLAALEATLRIYRDEGEAIAQIPTLHRLLMQPGEIEGKALRLTEALRKLADARMSLTSVSLSSRAGGGALPMLDLPSHCVGVHIDGQSANTIEQRMRNHKPSIIGRIENDLFILDPRTIEEGEIGLIAEAFGQLLGETQSSRELS